MLSSADSIRKLRRVHGFQLPLHPLQVSGWLTIASLSAGSFLVVIPALPLHWQPASSATLSTLLLLHLAANLGASLVDPAEPALRKTAPEPIPELDRSKHAHVIEEGRCHLCKIRTSTEKTKHCGACNKCVERFDHHCKWLNHCIGARNYVPFLMCVSTAVGAAAFVAILAISQLILHQKETGWFTKPENLTLTTQSSLPSGDAAFLAIVAILGLLAAVTAGLLLHLCFFHIYISFLGLTTYEYIRQNKIPQPPQPQTEETGQNEESSLSCSNLRHRPADLFCHGRSKMTVFTCTVIEETVSCAEPTPTPPSTPQDCHTCVVMNNSVVPDKVLPNKRVKQKWNCCVSVPDSPESPLEPKCLMSLCRHKSRGKNKIPAIEGRPHRTHGHWSSAKLRVLFRVLGNFGNNRGRHQKAASAKNNQVVPLSHDSNSTNEQTPIQTISNLVPVPSIPDHRHPILPALPPPQRRRMISEVELTNALTILQQQQHHQQQRCLGRRPLLPQYRRRRRSNVHRTKTPALSPIRESGLSNPASPSRQNCTL